MSAETEEQYQTRKLLEQLVQESIVVKDLYQAGELELDPIDLKKIYDVVGDLIIISAKGR
jgi:hypothetical protein